MIFVFNGIHFCQYFQDENGRVSNVTKMNCCSDEKIGSHTAAQMVTEALEWFRLSTVWAGEWFKSDTTLSCLFALHVAIVVAFLASHCRRNKSE